MLIVSPGVGSSLFEALVAAFGRTILDRRAAVSLKAGPLPHPADRTALVVQCNVIDTVRRLSPAACLSLAGQAERIGGNAIDFLAETLFAPPRLRRYWRRDLLIALQTVTACQAPYWAWTGGERPCRVLRFRPATTPAAQAKLDRYIAANFTAWQALFTLSPQDLRRHDANRIVSATRCGKDEELVSVRAAIGMALLHEETGE